MAVFNVTITVPDDKVADLQAALRDRYSRGSIEGTSLTNAQLKQRFDAEVREMLATLYRNYKAKTATTPELGVTE